MAGVTPDDAHPAGRRDSAPSEGEEFGCYQLLDLLGRGGMGEVWRAFDRRRGRVVALKRLPVGWADVPEFQERFRREARATARLRSPHVVLIHDFGEIRGQLFIDMRLIRGGDLATALTTSPGGLGVSRSLDLVQQVAAGLDAAHRDRLIHRDIKPSNILLEPDETRELAYLVDFGIAKATDETTGAVPLTATGTTMGTLAYMAPELFGGADHAGVPSDVYALGCVLFEMLTGRRPFTAAGTAGLIGQHLHAPPPRPSDIAAQLTPFDPVVARALAKDPALRHPTAGALAGEAAAAARRSMPTSHGTGAPDPASVHRSSGPAAGAPSGAAAVARPEEPTDARRRRPRRLLLATAILVAAVLVLLGVVLWPSADTTSASRSPVAPPAVDGSAGPGAFVATPLQVPALLASTGDVAVSSDGRLVYALRTGQNGGVTSFDASTGAVRGVVAVGPFPEDVAASPDGARVYVVNQGTVQNPDRTISVIDTASQQVVATITVGPLPDAVAVSPDSRRIYVTNGNLVGDPQSNSVSVIDAATDAVVATVPVGPLPNHMIVSRDGRFVYVPNTGSNPKGTTVSVLDTATNTVTRTLGVGGAPRSLAVSPAGDKLYVATAGTPDTAPHGALDVVDLLAGTVSVLDPAIIDTPRAVALSPDGRTLVVTNDGAPGRGGDPANDVIIIDTASGAVVHRVHTTAEPKQIAITQDGRTAYIASLNPPDLWRIPLT